MLFILTPLLLLVAVPLLGLWLGTHAALWAKRLAERQRGETPGDPVAKTLDANFVPDSEDTWPPKPTSDPPAIR